ncbi:hypothetical protein QUA41_30585 [Microcoleus sp. Pol11C1]|uniref:hypothetical protein n=1 Tax=unclassified Microcoleus TaxID=2642155 RepID=UPI002FD75683
MVQRFSNIRKSIKDGLTGADLTAYKAFRRGDTKIDAKNVARGPSVRKVLSPFFDESFTALVSVKISGRAFAALGSTGVSQTNLGLDDIPSPLPVGTTLRKLKRYSPAKMIAFIPTAAPPTTPKSTITTLEYKKIAGESFTLPIGKRATPGFRNWLEIMASLEAEVSPGVRISFQVENF